MAHWGFTNVTNAAPLDEPSGLGLLEVGKDVFTGSEDGHHAIDEMLLERLVVDSRADGRDTVLVFVEIELHVRFLELFNYLLVDWNEAPHFFVDVHKFLLVAFLEQDVAEHLENFFSVLVLAQDGVLKQVGLAVLAEAGRLPTDDVLDLLNCISLMFRALFQFLVSHVLIGHSFIFKLVFLTLNDRCLGFFDVIVHREGARALLDRGLLFATARLLTRCGVLGCRSLARGAGHGKRPGICYAAIRGLSL